MPALFVIALILLGIALAAGIVAVSMRKTPAIGVTALAGTLGLLFVLFSSVNTVPTRNVGIVTSFNKPTGEVTGAGLQWVKPWENVDDWDASRQSFDHRGEKSCVQVRITGLQNACVELLVEWTTDPHKAPEQWASYKREFGNFVEKRVEPNITGAINDAFGDHDPLANVDEATGQVRAPETKVLAERIKANIETRIGADIDVQSIVIGFVRYDGKTQESIEAFQQKILAGKNLLQDEKNALVQKRVTETNAQVDEVTRCLEIADKHSKEPGFCLGGGNPVQPSK